MPTDEEIIKGLEAELRLLDEERGPVCTFDVMLELLLSCLASGSPSPACFSFCVRMCAGVRSRLHVERM